MGLDQFFVVVVVLFSFWWGGVQGCEDGPGRNGKCVKWVQSVKCQIINKNTVLEKKSEKVK